MFCWYGSAVSDMTRRCAVDYGEKFILSDYHNNNIYLLHYIWRKRLYHLRMICLYTRICHFLTQFNLAILRVRGMMFFLYTDYIRTAYFALCFHRNYTAINYQEQRTEYRNDFSSEYQEYLNLHRKVTFSTELLGICTNLILYIFYFR